MRPVQFVSGLGTGRGVSLSSFFCFIVLIAVSLIAFPGSMLATDNSDWMGRLADDMLISELTIPGTHETMALHGGLYAECQNLLLADQLYRGIRFIDIRIRHEWNTFSIYHGDVNQYAKFGPGVLNVCVGFLEAHPTETILMRVKEQDNGRHNDSTFSQTLRWYLEPVQEFIYESDDYLVIPTLGELRGKIYIVQDFNSDPGAPDFGPRYGSGYPQFLIQDNYHSYHCLPGNAEKTPGGKWMKHIQPHRENMIYGRRDVIWINYLSAFMHVHGPHGMAWGCGGGSTHQHGMNERYIEHPGFGLIRYMGLYQSPWCLTSQREGAVMMDFFDEQTRRGEYLVDLLIPQNPDIPYRNPDWMSQMPKCRLISELSIPGTHQSLARYPTTAARCQILPLETQLRAGIRGLEVICFHENDRFRVYSQVRPGRFEEQPAWFGAAADSTGPSDRGHANVLKECVKFLMDYPSEAILLRVQSGSGPGGTNTRDFWETFEWYITEDGGNFGPNGEYVRYGDYVWQSDDYSTVPTMDEVRGKIVFLRDFSSPEQFGLVWSSLSVQNSAVANVDEIPAKWDSVYFHLERATSGAPGTMYANFLSGALTTVDPLVIANGPYGPSTIDQGMNQRTYDFLRQQRDQGNILRCGIVMMDFPGPGLIEAVIDHNEIPPPPEPVSVDIKPGSCPNPLNFKTREKGKSVLPVAILGAVDFDVSRIDPSTVTLECVEPLRSSIEDVGTPADPAVGDCACTDDRSDGHLDLTLKFLKADILNKIRHKADSAQIFLTLYGELYDGTLIEGYDCIVPRGTRAPQSQDSDSKVALPSIYPKPLNRTAQISFELPRASHVRLDVYNVRGQKVATVVDAPMSAGYHTVSYDASGNAAGVYFYRLQAGEHVETRKMLLLK
jgi:hypothetical protein